jgi:hypothetical protein
VEDLYLDVSGILKSHTITVLEMYHPLYVY